MVNGSIHYRVVVDLQKLFKYVDGKRRSDKLTWARLAARYGISAHTLQGLGREYQTDRKSPKKDTYSSVLVSMLDFLNRPYTDFIKKVPLEVEDGSSE